MHRLKIELIEDCCLRILKNRAMIDGPIFRPIFASTTNGKSHFVKFHYKAAPQPTLPPPFPEGTDYDTLLSEEDMTCLR